MKKKEVKICKICDGEQLLAVTVGVNQTVPRVCYHCKGEGTEPEGKA